MKQAILVLDMLNDFVQPGAPLEVPGVRAMVPSIQRRLEDARVAKRPVIYVCDAHQPNDPEFRVWPPHAIRGTEGQAVIKELFPHREDFLLTKPSYSAFFETKLDALLKKLKVDELVLTGVCTEICVLYTGVDALERGYRVQVPEDCVRGLTEADHRFALRQLKEVLKPRQR